MRPCARRCTELMVVRRQVPPLHVSPLAPVLLLFSTSRGDEYMKATRPPTWAWKKPANTSKRAQTPKALPATSSKLLRRVRSRRVRPQSTVTKSATAGDVGCVLGLHGPSQCRTTRYWYSIFSCSLEENGSNKKSKQARFTPEHCEKKSLNPAS